MSAGFPIREYRFASQNEGQHTDSAEWTDIPGLALVFDATDAGSFLVSVNIPAMYNLVASPDYRDGGSYAGVRVVLREGSGAVQTLAQVVNAPPSTPPPVSVSFQCEAKIGLTNSGSQIAVQWQAVNGASLSIDSETWCTLSAVGSLQPRKEAFDDPHHFENPALFSRGLRLTNFTETLFITGYSATPSFFNLHPPGVVPENQTPSEQMQWIVDHLDEYFATIPYADGTGTYSRHDIVYYDVCIDQSVSSEEQEAVLDILMAWFGAHPGQPDSEAVSPKPSTGILKKVEALALETIQVEMELILAH